MKFIGIDLGWKSQPSGLCCLELVDEHLDLLDLDRIELVADVLLWLDNCVELQQNAIAFCRCPYNHSQPHGNAFT